MLHGIFIEVIKSSFSGEVVASDGVLLPLLGPVITGQVLGSGTDDEANVLTIPGAVGCAAPDGGSAVAAAGPAAALLAVAEARLGAGAAAAGRVADLPYNARSSPTMTNYNKVIQNICSALT